MDSGFYGAGCQNVGVECLVEQANKLIMHYSCPLSLGLEMKILLEYLILELGILPQPLQQSHGKYDKRITHS